MRPLRTAAAVARALAGAARDRAAWRRACALAAVLALAAALLGFLVMATGAIPIRASSGHWPITEALLTFATRRSVATDSLGVEVPPLDDPALVHRGAGHFETGCSPCHGNPDNRSPPIAGRMAPPPPWLPQSVGSWSDAQLFTIVAHGIKFAGMPAWPAPERADEVWAVVAFLRVLPTLDAAAYRRLADGEAAAPGPAAELEEMAVSIDGPRALLATCARCHGVAGLGRGVGAFPRLAGQREVYLAASLEAYAAGARPSGIMRPIAAGLRAGEVRALARHFASLPPPPPVPIADPAAFAAGEAIARRGVPADRVPACAACHGPFAHDEPIDPHYPRLAGQWPGYLEQQLRLFQAGGRGGTAFGRVMGHVGVRLRDEQIRAVAAYYASATIP